MKFSRMNHDHDVAPSFVTKVWCYAPISDGSLGVAVANERGYTPVPKGLACLDTYDQASAECDRINSEYLGLSEETAMKIVTSTMVKPEASKESKPEQRFDHLEVEAALCVWECINDWTVNYPEQKRADWVKLRDAVGSMEMRYQSMEIGQWCLKVHALCVAEDTDCFDAFSYDWEVIPEIMSHARDEHGPVIYTDALPSPDTVAPKVIEHFKRQFWWSQARSRASQIYGYADLVNDDKERSEQAYKAGEDPEHFVRWLGEKHGLIESRPYG